jgi:AcrR family transcriptional regulator
LTKAKNDIPKISAEEKIKQSARELFTQKGFAATKTRDIAEKAGINLALLNYYFRSKQKLFDLIMEENMVSFRTGIIQLFGDTEMELEQKIETIVEYYIDAFLENRDLPAFIISIIHNHQHSPIKENKFYLAIGNAQKIFLEQIKSHLQKKGVNTIHPAHVITNLMSLIFFPFTSSTMLKSRAGLNENDFIALMQERKKLIPLWILSMMEPVTTFKKSKQ